MSRHRGFTLIELLVVISIVGLLSSIVLVSLNTAREKGRIAGLRSFAAQVDHIAGEQAVGIWDFDDCSNTIAVDRSGFNNNGSIISATASSDTPSNKGCSISLNGTTSYINIPHNTSGILDPKSEDFSVSIWFKSSLANNGGLIQKKSNGAGVNPGWKLGFRVSDGNQFQSLVSDGVVQVGSSYNLTVVTDGRWHHAVLVIDRIANTVAIYVDGIRRSSASTASIGSISNTLPFRIGVDNDVNFFSGLIDEVRIFAKSLTALEVNKLYAAEALQFKLAEN